MLGKLEVLLSCMYQKDTSVIEQSNLQNVKTLVINQTNEDCIINQECSNGSKLISTIERGVSNSRNMAITNATGECCLFADDDEFFVDDVADIIVDEFEKHPEVDIMIFKISNFPKGQRNCFYRMKRLDLLKVASVQIAIKLSSVKGRVWFDEKLGAGTINQAGEENKFLLDCYKAGLNISYTPVEIGALRDSESTWFSGFSEKYFFTRGKILRYILGLPLTTLYNIYFVLTKQSLYKSNISPYKALKHLMIGSLTKDIDKEFMRNSK